MKEQLRKTLEMLKNHVQGNLSNIHMNEKHVREILQEPVSHQRSALISEQHKVNKKILEENSDFIRLQLEIIKFMDKHRTAMNNEISKFKEPNDKPEQAPKQSVDLSDSRRPLLF